MYSVQLGVPQIVRYLLDTHTCGRQKRMGFSPTWNSEIITKSSQKFCDSIFFSYFCSRIIY